MEFPYIQRWMPARDSQPCQQAAQRLIFAQKKGSCEACSRPCMSSREVRLSFVARGSRSSEATLTHPPSILSPILGPGQLGQC